MLGLRAADREEVCHTTEYRLYVGSNARCHVSGEAANVKQERQVRLVACLSLIFNLGIDRSAVGIRTASIEGQPEPPVTEDTVVALAPLRAVAPLSVTVGDGIAQIRWATDVTGERLITNEIIPFHRKQGAMPPEATSLLQRTWYLLDDKMEIIMNRDDYDNTEWQRARFEARGIAEVLAMFMVPHFTTADEIAGEARDRYLARKNGNDSYETKGLGVRKLTVPEPKTAPETVAPTKAAPKAKTGNRIPDSAVESSKQGIQMGMFTADQIGKMYKMSAAEVKQQLGIA